MSASDEADFETFLAANQDAQLAMGVREGSSPWVGSPFEWVMSLASRSRGKAGEMLVEAWLRRIGLTVRPPANSGHDRLVNGSKIEIKFSTLWQAGQYVFQQLRNQDYEHVLLLGISPQEVSVWMPPKAVAFDHAIPQHGGAAGTDTRWLRFDAAAPPGWLHDYGGSLAEGAAYIRRIL